LLFFKPRKVRPQSDKQKLRYTLKGGTSRNHQKSPTFFAKPPVLFTKSAI